MREFLILKLKCSVCGTLLNLEYHKDGITPYAEGEPTGAAAVNNIVVVQPCKTCKRESDSVVSALRVLTTAAKNEQ